MPWKLRLWGLTVAVLIASYLTRTDEVICDPVFIVVWAHVQTFLYRYLLRFCEILFRFRRLDPVDPWRGKNRVKEHLGQSITCLQQRSHFVFKAFVTSTYRYQAFWKLTDSKTEKPGAFRAPNINSFIFASVCHCCPVHFVIANYASLCEELTCKWQNHNLFNYASQTVYQTLP